MRVSKKIIITLLVVVEICSVYLIYKSYNNKKVLNNKQEEPKVREKMAIKVENDEGKYEFASSFPGAGYIINNDMTECVDQAGNKVDGVSFSSDGTSVTVTSKYTAYCTLYFKKLWSLGTYCDGQANMETCMANKKNTIGKVENMTSKEVGGMYRYQGIVGVNNWICFGTTDKAKCINNINTAPNSYVYRIIGVTADGQLVLIKESGAYSSSVDWNSYTTNRIWPSSTLFNRLNGLCNSNNANCNGQYTGGQGTDNIFIGSSSYEYLSEENIWLDKINTHLWKYGDTSSFGNYNGDEMYAIENAFSDTKEAKIGLQYIHDYYYAFPGGNPGSGNAAKNAWIYYNKDGTFNNGSMYEWLITRSEENEMVRFIGQDGSVGRQPQTYYGRALGLARPVFYLKPDVKISPTAGTKDDPFMITN